MQMRVLNHKEKGKYYLSIYTNAMQVWTLIVNQGVSPP